MLRSTRLKPLLTYRAYSTKAVELSFDKHAIRPSQDSPLLICHGLFGSKKNWSSLAKAFSSRLSRDVYTIIIKKDLRNHGDSPHSEEHTYEAMTTDLVEFISKHNLKAPILLGHSMGGKAVMATALQHPEMVSKLVVVDMPPVAMTLSRNFATYVDAMREIEAANVSKQSEADKILAKYESNIGIRMFLLTNLRRSDNNVFQFRVPYEILGRSLPSIGAFDIPSHLSYPKPTLFIAGGKSPYRIPFEEQSEWVNQLFPQSRLEVVEQAGHWGKGIEDISVNMTDSEVNVVHAEKPDIVLTSVTQFINN
ncbi:Abhydrolase domain-containing protein C22H12.03 [Choanephora cucurbitarum]|uniref:Abhydrolase domain-containing protein C22H12.03 n=1 Tax=Choanephora cucurbitarum TaxID=101091 RepID=A0A1C7NNG9_9FUNG|nr:Abhydrolase domain-containing protein C22H12.03 [Choanephora cucurbitarum]